MAKNPKYVAIFLKEASEHLASLIKGIIALEAAPSDAALMHELLRNAHSIKGAARMLALDPIGAVSHWMEDILKEVESGEVGATSALVDLLLCGCDAIKLMVANLEAGIDTLPDVAALLKCLSKRSLPPAKLLENLRLSPKPVAKAVDAVNVPVATIDALQERQGELFISKQKLEKRLKTLQQIARSSAGRTDGLWELQLQLEDDLLELDQLLTEINEQVMSLRLLPLRTVSDSFARVLRDVARTQGKQAVLNVIGEDCELDRVLLDQLRPALVHLLTNAVTHGLESPKERTASGKPPGGTITISARLAGDTAVITFEDDGRGMDPAAVRDKALELGLLTPSSSAALDDAEILSCTLLPGFSTSATVTDAFGRGVGLDAVNEAVTKVKGHLAIENDPGKGCRFVLNVPRTVLTTKALLVGAGGEKYLIPSGAIASVLTVDMSAFRSDHGEIELPEFGSVPVANLDLLLGSRSTVGTGSRHKKPLVLLKRGDKRLACLVDSLHDTLEVVVKRLSPQLKKVFLVKGGTILPNGDAVLILNTADLFSAADQSCYYTPPRPAASQPSHRILVVDDSISSRSLLASILSAHGYLVDVAENGVEALEKFGQNEYHLLVSDIEMPLMNGLELVRTLRKRLFSARLPIVMVSSLRSAADRQQAVNSGAQVYLVKGEFDQDVFLNHVQELLIHPQKRSHLWQARQL